ncbi:MAG: PhoH family protein [Pirellulales bacterium]
MNEAIIPVGNPKELVSLFGALDHHLRRIRETVQVGISTRDGVIHIEGEDAAVAQATEILEQLKQTLSRDGSLDSQQVAETISRVTGTELPPEDTAVEVRQGGRQVRPRTSGQARYVKAIREHDLVFCVGPAGTGKTYLAVATAVEAFKQQQFQKIVLVRPAVEAGESLGYLPGDLQAKINPYLRPLLDALREMLSYDQIQRYMAEDVIEVIPLAYMRGRTLNRSFIILDEAQNTTVSQMKMFLTRMGLGSKVVVSGDVTQVDLPPHTRSGLSDALTRLKGIKGFCHVTLDKGDIVRHQLVQAIVHAYEEGPGKRR